jgi:hypothetical protein
MTKLLLVITFVITLSWCSLYNPITVEEQVRQSNVCTEWWMDYKVIVNWFSEALRVICIPNQNDHD